MRVLLPPSEAKNPGGRGRPLRGRAHPLASARRTVHDTLTELIAADRDCAAAALLLPDSAAPAALRANSVAFDSPTTPALRRYAGVVYDGLDYPAADAAVQRAAHHNVLIFSGLLGVVRGDEPVPQYRVPAKAALPGLGIAATYWRPHLTALFDEASGLLGRGLIVDLRSGDYAAMWRPGRGVRDRVVSVRVLSPLPRGGHGIISYNSKLAKGRLARALLEQVAAGHQPTTVADIVAAWRASGGRQAVPTAGGIDLYAG